MRTDAESHVAPLQRTEFGIAQPCLACHEQQDTVTSSDPRGLIGSRNKRCSFVLGEKLDRSALVALGRDRQNALALQRARRLCVRDKPEECAQGSQASVACLRAVGALLLQGVEKRSEKRYIELFHV